MEQILEKNWAERLICLSHMEHWRKIIRSCVSERGVAKGGVVSGDNDVINLSIVTKDGLI